MPIRIVCSCGAKLNAKEELVGKSVKCPKCGNPIKVTAEGDAPAAEAPAAKPKTPAKPKAEPAAMNDLFDEIGLAPVQPKAELPCPKCGAAMKEGDIICVSCGYNVKSGKQLASVSDSAAEANRERVYAQQAAKAAAQAAKNPNPYAPPRYSGKPDKPDKPEAELEPLDWVVCLLCSGIGCICGIVYLITGNPKGPKMLLISILATVVKNILVFAFSAMQGGIPH